jgi:hypothetical protein
MAQCLVAQPSYMGPETDSRWFTLWLRDGSDVQQFALNSGDLRVPPSTRKTVRRLARVLGVRG